MQPQREVTNAMFREFMRMLSQGVTNQVGLEKGARQDKTNMSLRGFENY